MLNLGPLQIVKLYLGSTEIDLLMLGGLEIYPASSGSCLWENNELWDNDDVWYNCPSTILDFSDPNNSQYLTIL